jgi:putative N-acetyltransferase (TIGR04045 family)
MELSILEGARLRTTGAPQPQIGIADPDEVAEYRAIRREVFVDEQGIFDGHDLDRIDDDPRTVVLVARTPAGIVGGVRLAPADDGPDLGWWTGSRLVVRRAARRGALLGTALVRAACAAAESRGVLRFEATVQAPNELMFRHIGWTTLGPCTLAGVPHVRMRYPMDRLDRQAQAAKSPLGALVGAFARLPGGLGGAGFVGDDGAPVPGSDLVAVCDAIVPSMVERHPEWAGWCSVLVNINDLTAMGADAIGLLDAVGARDASFAARVLRGVRDASEAWGVPVLGGHTQLGVPAALSVTGLGRTASPVAAGAARIGDVLSCTVDLSGGWRPGFVGMQWDSTSHRRGDELREMAGSVGRARPRAAKDVSMAGLVGTIGMMAEAAGVGAVVDVASVPRPAGVGVADWFSCFPGFGMITADPDATSRIRSAHAVSATVGRIAEEPGVRLRWPDGEETPAVTTAVTNLGAA